MKMETYVGDVEIGKLIFEVYSEKRHDGYEEITFISTVDDESFCNFSNSSGYTEHINGVFSSSLDEYALRKYNIDIDKCDVFDKVYYKGMVDYIKKNNLLQKRKHPMSTSYKPDKQHKSTGVTCLFYEFLRSVRSLRKCLIQ